MYEICVSAIDFGRSGGMSVRADGYARSFSRRTNCGCRQILSAGSTPVPVVGSLRQLETVKVYGINRYVDAADSRVLHERHAVYRLEQQPAWITRSPRNQEEVILGPDCRFA